MDWKGAWQDYQDNEDGDWYDFANRFWPDEPREDLDGDDFLLESDEEYPDEEEEEKD